MQTNSEGRYEFTTIKPSHYKIDCRPMPAHIHYRVSYLDNDPVFQTVFFTGDPYLTNILVDSASIRPLTPQGKADGPILRTTFDIVLPVDVDNEALEVRD